MGNTTIASMDVSPLRSTLNQCKQLNSEKQREICSHSRSWIRDRFQVRLYDTSRAKEIPHSNRTSICCLRFRFPRLFLPPRRIPLQRLLAAIIENTLKCRCYRIHNAQFQLQIPNTSVIVCLSQHCCCSIKTWQKCYYAHFEKMLYPLILTNSMNTDMIAFYFVLYA